MVLGTQLIIFLCRDKDVGKIESITIGHNNKGLGAGWCFTMVEVKNLTTSSSACFVYDGWIPTEPQKHNTVTLNANQHIKEKTR